MAESDIEFLDEDADIVQKCVQVQTIQYVAPPGLVPIEDEKLTPLLVERRPIERRRKRKKVDEDDSDYDPSQDLAPQSPPSPKVKKKKQQVLPKKVIIKKVLKDVPNLKEVTKPKQFTAEEPLIKRENLSIRIPDYDDPLCLPVKAIKQEHSDIKRLNNWNNVCLEHFKHCDNLLKPEKGETNSSTRTVVFRNVVNKQSGKTDTTIWSKTCVENEDGDRKSEIFQCVLPRYKEKKTPTPFTFSNRKAKPYYLSDEVILSKEEPKDSGEILVVYKPQESLSAVYKLVTDDKGNKEDTEDKEDDEIKSYIKEILCTKMCVPCFQMSWRGVMKNDDKPMRCPICKRCSFVTAYNLLTHFKTHSSEEIRKYKSVISGILAEVVEYHYKCRICCEQINSIKSLRQHLTTHQGNEPFTCEVGCHVTR